MIFKTHGTHSDFWCLYSNIKISFLHKSVMYPESVQLWCKLFLDDNCIKLFPSVVSLVGISWPHCFLLILCWWGWTWDRSRCFCGWAGVRKGFYSRTQQGCEEGPRLSSLLTLAAGPWPHHLPRSLSSLLCPTGFCQLVRALRGGRNEEGRGKVPAES